MTAGYSLATKNLAQTRAANGVAISIFGHAAALGTTTQSIYSNASIATVHFAATTVKVASISTADDAGGTGALTVTLSGIDGSGDAQSEIITLDGQTEVTSANQYTAINGLDLLTAGTGEENAGDLWVGNGTFTSGVPATKYFVAEALFGRGTLFSYTVPNGKVLRPYSFFMSIGDTSKFAEIRFLSSTGSVHYVFFAPSVSSGSVVYPVDGFPGAIAAGSTLSAKGEVNTGTADVFCILVAHLEDA